MTAVTNGQAAIQESLIIRVGKLLGIVSFMSGEVISCVTEDNVFVFCHGFECQHVGWDTTIDKTLLVKIFVRQDQEWSRRPSRT